MGELPVGLPESFTCAGQERAHAGFVQIERSREIAIAVPFASEEEEIPFPGIEGVQSEPDPPTGLVRFGRRQR
jgi:hypothetical protein